MPDTEGKTRFMGARTHSGISPSLQDKQVLSFLPCQERNKVLAAAKEIGFPSENTRLHKNIRKYKTIVTTWNKNDSKIEGAQRNFSSYSVRPPFLAGVISKETLPRIYRILSALYRQVEILGGVVNEDLSVQVRGENISLNIYEG